MFQYSTRVVKRERCWQVLSRALRATRPLLVVMTGCSETLWLLVRLSFFGTALSP